MLQRLRAFLTSRRLLIALTVLVGVLGVGYLLFASFVFDPLEDSLEDTASIVPRDVEYFFRWQDAGASFANFPEPAVWSELKATEVYDEIEAGGGLDLWSDRTGLGELFGQVGDMTGVVPAGLSLKNDFLREVAFTGKGEPSLGANFDGMLMLRVSFKVKAGVAMLNFGFVRDKLPEDLGIVKEGDYYRLPGFFEGNDAFLTRSRDIVLLASSAEWLDQAMDLQLKGGEDSLAFASVFHDNVTAFLGEADQPVEVFMRWERLRGAMPSFPPQGGDSGFIANAFSAFFTTDLLRIASGYWLPGKRFQVRLSGDVDSSRATSEFQKNWLESSSVSVNHIRDFAGVVPADSFFFSGFAGRTDEVLIEIEGALDSETRRLLDEIATGTGRYNGMVDLLRAVSVHFQPGIFIAMRRNDYAEKVGENKIEHDDTPVPAIAILARATGGSSYEDLQAMIARDMQRLVGGEVRQWNLPLAGGANGKSFSSPAIPGTGEIILAEIPALKAVMVCNHWDYATNISQLAMTSTAGDRKKEKLSSSDSFRSAIDSVDGGASLFAWLEPSEARPWLDLVAEDFAVARFRDVMDQKYISERPTIERRLKQEMFGAEGRLNGNQQRQLNDAVDQAMEGLDIGERARQVSAFQAEFQQGLLPLQWMDWAALMLKANRRKASIVMDGALQLD
ncbi:MAG: hypothetical protein MK209_00525 [Planctomycetes bacterium]|nr:hypothetical protein [Planctomycetota bacterium]